MLAGDATGVVGCLAVEDDGRAMNTIGVDLAAQPKRTAVCCIDWRSGEVAFDELHADEDRLASRLFEADRVGIDAPFGWPHAFAESLAAHHAGGAWPVSYSREPDALRLRATDLHVRRLPSGEGGGQPLSVSSDKIAVLAMRCAHLLGLAAAREPVDRAGLDGRFVEVYPAAALRAWGLPARGYKGRKPEASAVRANLVDALLAAVPRLASDAARKRLRQVDHELDAFVCALVARAAAAGRTIRPPGDLLPRARREGWIHVPAAPLPEAVEEPK